MANLTSLDVDYRNSQLSEVGLNGLPSMTDFTLWRLPSIEKVELTDLPNLTNLTITDGNLSVLSLNEVFELNNVRLDNNQLSDISALSGMTNLTSLSMDNNQLSDISALSGMTNLTSLSMDNNQLSDISALSGMTNLTSLRMDNNQLSDISALSGMTNLVTLTMSNNQLSDISALSGMTNLVTLTMSNNQLSDISALSNTGYIAGGGGSLDLSNNRISDVSSLVGWIANGGMNLDNNSISDLSSWNERVSSLSENELYFTNTYCPVSIENQSITLPEIKWSSPLEMPVTVKDYNNTVVTPSAISDNGQFADDVITWAGLSNVNQDVTYSWIRQPLGSSNYVFNPRFSGTATTRVTPVGVKILVDDDGDSQTTGDQTLFAEKTNDIEYLEDIYNYAKEQLSGTDYGLVDVQADSTGDFYTFIVSKVGSLKTKDVNGDSIGTDKAYTPTYTVTGTGNAAQLDVSYGATVDSVPGYVYIYEKNTPQEVRYVPGANVNVSLTDTNGNGKPQWQEDYTVVQYQKAGGLNPTLPDGSQVPGGTIAIPDDSIEGDRIT
ncbi:leucine-rich repeat domain-containing protein, partial [Listeria monocytogenes]|uniref:leucine-rich repeat domain-containing protein n=1 Tax=Listeria monocytogenes TaxID=1639 RepID=UPI0011EB4C0F